MTTRVGRTLSAWVLATTLAGALTACGDGSSTAADPGSSPSSAGSSTPPSSVTGSPSGTTSTPPPSGPACAQVWREGATLPGSYQGCLEGDQYVDRDTLGCSSGQKIVRYDEHFYGVPGGRIHQTESVLDKDRGYRNAVAVCRG